jgi:N-acetylneuraminic acid mutarotase
MDDFPGGGRYSACAFAIGNYGYVGTGYGDGLIDNTDFYRFDPTAASGSQWTKVRSLGGDKREDAMALPTMAKDMFLPGIIKQAEVI